MDEKKVDQATLIWLWTTVLKPCLPFWLPPSYILDVEDLLRMFQKGTN